MVPARSPEICKALQTLVRSITLGIFDPWACTYLHQAVGLESSGWGKGTEPTPRGASSPSSSAPSPVPDPSWTPMSWAVEPSCLNWAYRLALPLMAYARTCALNSGSIMFPSPTIPASGVTHQTSSEMHKVIKLGVYWDRIRSVSGVSHAWYVRLVGIHMC